MHILLTGSTGFIGHTVQRALTQAGHTVHACVSPRQRTPSADQMVVNFASDTQPSTWLPRLAGIDAVVNAVGVLRDSAATPMEAIHRDTPQALFTACVQAGVRRVVQLSALGVTANSTRYATTKRAADNHLLGLAHTHPELAAIVLRPSVVFGRGGDGSALFMQLAKLPVALLPGPVIDAQIQPISVHDVAQAVVALLDNNTPGGHLRGTLECTGPQALSMGDFIASLRQQCGRSPARVLRLPSVLTQLSARMGDLVPSVPWCSEAVTMLHTGNTGDPAPLAQLLGRPAVHYSQLVRTAWQ